MPRAPKAADCPHCREKDAEIRRLRAQLAAEGVCEEYLEGRDERYADEAEGVCEEYLEGRDERYADEVARLTERVASLEAQLAVASDLAKARGR